MRKTSSARSPSVLILALTTLILALAAYAMRAAAGTIAGHDFRM
jgi:hypothetical protein